MTPEYLACPTTNSQLEPIRRRIEATISTQQQDIDPNYSNNVGLQKVFPSYSDSLPKLSTTSLDNPLLALSEGEYRTLRRYQEERQLPERFLGQTAAQDNALYAPMKPPPSNPSFQTSSQEYGKYPPNKHTLPQSYHGLRTKFTARKTEQGNFRNHSLNL